MNENRRSSLFQRERFTRLAFLALAGMALLAVMIFIATTIVRSRNNMLEQDFFQFWLGGRMLRLGQNIYDPVIWAANHQLYGSKWLGTPIFHYPLPLAYLFYILGLFPINVAGAIFIVISQILLVVSVWVLSTQNGIPRTAIYLTPVIAGFFLFRPTIVTLINGHLGALLLFALTLAGYFFHQKKWWFGGFSLGFLLLKPTFGIMVVAFIAIWLLREHDWKALGGILVFVITILLGSLLISPVWVSALLEFGASLTTSLFQYTPTIWGLSGISCGYEPGCTAAVGAVPFIAIGLLALLALWRWHDRFSVWGAMAVAVAVSVLITPYLWIYDQVLLIIPLTYIIGWLISHKASYILTAALMLLFALLSMVLTSISATVQRDVFSAMTSFLVLAILSILIMKDRSTLAAQPGASTAS